MSSPWRPGNTASLVPAGTGDCLEGGPQPPCSVARSQRQRTELERPAGEKLGWQLGAARLLLPAGGEVALASEAQESRRDSKARALDGVFTTTRTLKLAR